MDRAAFLRTLKQSRILSEEQVSAFERRFAQEGRPLQLARALIAENLLSPFQIRQVLAGRGNRLVLGQYRLLEEVGRGGMGSVFKALHTVMGRVVALKIINEDLVSDAHTLDMFQREVRAATALHHPNIVMAYDANEVDGTHFLVMEYIAGPDLGTVVRRDGPLPIASALDLLRQAARALQHAHEKGLVHRDIKPSNLLLAPGDTESGSALPTLKVLDFGIARLRKTNETITVRKPGAIIGTPDYISPEQATDIHQADIRSDLYSLGCTFYFALSGQVPFPGQSILEKVLHHALDNPPPVCTLRADIPDNLATIVHRLMHKNPDQRFQTPADLLAELEKLPLTPVVCPEQAKIESLPEVAINEGAFWATLPESK